MAAFNFPNSPSTNDTHTENGVTYKWNGTVWKRQNTSYTDATNLNVTGIGTFAGAVHIGGVLTYEDVKNVDSVGVITARGVIDAQGYINLAQKIIHTGDADTSIEFPSNDTIKFETAGTERIRITSAGRVGVGNRTSNPDELLHVHTGSGQANIHVEGATDGQIILRAHSGNSVIHFGDASSTSVGKILYEHNNDEFVFNTSATERVRITASGIITKYDTRNVSIRNAAGTTRGHLQANGSGIDLQSHVNSSGFITFSTNGGGTPAERLRITSAGLVGIGIDAPTSRLYVNGVSTNDIITARSADSNGNSVINILSEGTTGSSRIVFSDTAAATGDAWISYSHNDRALRFSTAGVGNERLRIDSSGLISNGGLSPSDYGSPKLLISGTNSLFTMMGNGSINNSSYTGIKFRVAGGSTGDYTKAGIFVVRQASYNYLDMLFCFNTAANATGVSDGDEKVRIKSDGLVLIGTNTKPNDINKLVVRGTSPADSFDSQCHLEGSETSGAAHTGGALAFAGHDGSSYRNWGNIYGMKENSTGGNTASYMAFHTRPNGGSPTERLRINSDSSMLHTRSDNTNRYDLEFRNTGGIGNGNYGGIRWTQGSTGSTFLSGIQIAYHDTGRPDMVFWIRDTGGSAGSHEGMRIDRDGKLSLSGDTDTYLDRNTTNTWQIKTNGTLCTEFSANQRVRMPQVYSTNGSSMRDVWIESDGTLCAGNTSIRAAKKNIVSQTDVSWLYDLNPVTFNYRKHTVDEVTGVNTYLEETLDETSYGLIAEEVETVNQDFCLYNDGELAGVSYSQLITPLLKAVQDQKKEIDTLKAEVATLKGS